jgi:hypothetical protein
MAAAAAQDQCALSAKHLFWQPKAGCTPVMQRTCDGSHCLLTHPQHTKSCAVMHCRHPTGASCRIRSWPSHPRRSKVQHPHPVNTRTAASHVPACCSAQNQPQHTCLVASKPNGRPAMLLDAMCSCCVVQSPCTAPHTAGPGVFSGQTRLSGHAYRISATVSIKVCNSPAHKCQIKPTQHKTGNCLTGTTQWGCM